MRGLQLDPELVGVQGQAQVAHPRHEREHDANGAVLAGLQQRAELDELVESRILPALAEGGLPGAREHAVVDEPEGPDLGEAGGEAGGGQMRWTDLEGDTQGLEGDPGDIGVISLSKDGRWLALTLSGGPSGADDIWIRDLVRGVTSRFTFPTTTTATLRGNTGSRLARTSTRASLRCNP